MWTVIEEVFFEGFYSAFEKPYGIYSTEEAAHKAVSENDLKGEYGVPFHVIYVEVRG